MGGSLPSTSGLSVGFSNEIDFRVGFRGSVHGRVRDFDGIRPANQSVLGFSIKSIHSGSNVRRSGRVGESHRRFAQFVRKSLVADAQGKPIHIEHALVRRKLTPLQCVCRPFFFGQSACHCTKDNESQYSNCLFHFVHRPSAGFNTWRLYRRPVGLRIQISSGVFASTPPGSK